MTERVQTHGYIFMIGASVCECATESSEGCGCGPGTTGPDAGPCVECDAGQFKVRCRHLRVARWQYIFIVREGPRAVLVKGIGSQIHLPSLPRTHTHSLSVSRSCSPFFLCRIHMGERLAATAPQAHTRLRAAPSAYAKKDTRVRMALSVQLAMRESTRT